MGTYPLVRRTSMERNQEAEDKIAYQTKADSLRRSIHDKHPSTTMATKRPLLTTFGSGSSALKWDRLKKGTFQSNKLRNISETFRNNMHKNKNESRDANKPWRQNSVTVTLPLLSFDDLSHERNPHAHSIPKKDGHSVIQNGTLHKSTGSTETSKASTASKKKPHAHTQDRRSRIRLLAEAKYEVELSMRVEEQVDSAYHLPEISARKDNEEPSPLLSDERENTGETKVRTNGSIVKELLQLPVGGDSEANGEESADPLVLANPLQLSPQGEGNRIDSSDTLVSQNKQEVEQPQETPNAAENASQGNTVDVLTQEDETEKRSKDTPTNDIADQEKLSDTAIPEQATVLGPISEEVEKTDTLPETDTQVAPPDEPIFNDPGDQEPSTIDATLDPQSSIEPHHAFPVTDMIPDSLENNQLGHNENKFDHLEDKSTSMHSPQNRIANTDIQENVPDADTNSTEQQVEIDSLVNKTDNNNEHSDNFENGFHTQHDETENSKYSETGQEIQNLFDEALIESDNHVQADSGQPNEMHDQSDQDEANARSGTISEQLPYNVTETPNIDHDTNLDEGDIGNEIPEKRDPTLDVTNDMETPDDYATMGNDQASSQAIDYDAIAKDRWKQLSATQSNIKKKSSFCSIS